MEYLIDCTFSALNNPVTPAMKNKKTSRNFVSFLVISSQQNLIFVWVIVLVLRSRSWSLGGSGIFRLRFLMMTLCGHTVTKRFEILCSSTLRARLVQQEDDNSYQLIDKFPWSRETSFWNLALKMTLERQPCTLWMTTTRVEAPNWAALADGIRPHQIVVEVDREPAHRSTVPIQSANGGQCQATTLSLWSNNVQISRRPMAPSPSFLALPPNKLCRGWGEGTSKVCTGERSCSRVFVKLARGWQRMWWSGICTCCNEPRR